MAGAVGGRRALSYHRSRVIMRRLLASCLCLFAAACADDRPDAPDVPPGNVEQITGNERIGWQQRAATAADLAALRFNIYVDDLPTEMQGVTCEAVPTAEGFACSARLPSLSRGRHVLQLTSFVDAGARLESGRSATLTVSVGLSALSALSAAAPVVTADGVRLIASTLTSGLQDPKDLAIAGGRIFVAERAGRIRVYRDAELQPHPAVEIDDVDATGGRGLLALAVDPAFEKTGHLYAVYTAVAGFRLVRYRAVGDTLGDRVTLVDGVDAPSSHPAATLRFGPDGKLYLGLDDGGDPARAGDLGSFNGKVLRLNPDGTTPSDQAGGTPVYALNVNQPRGMDWDGPTLWIAESIRLQGVVASTTPKRAAGVANYNLPQGIGSGPLLFYRGALVPQFTGELLLAGDRGRAVLRLRFDASDRRAIVSSEYLIRDVEGGIQALAAGAEGLLYYCTATDLVAIAPDSASSDNRPRNQM